MADDIIRFSTPDPHQGDPIPFEVEVVRVKRTKHTDPPEGAMPEWEPWVEETKEREVHTFHAVPDLSGGVLVQIDLMIAANRTSQGEHVRGGDALFDFLEAMVVEEERRTFMELIHAKDTYIHQQVLTDIALHFYRTYTNRPTKSPAS